MATIAREKNKKELCLRSKWVSAILVIAIVMTMAPGFAVEASGSYLSLERLAEAIKNDLRLVQQEWIGVRESALNSLNPTEVNIVSSLVTILNNAPQVYEVKEGLLLIDTGAFDALEPNDLWSVSELIAARQLAELLHGVMVRPAGGFMRAVWWEQEFLYSSHWTETRTDRDFRIWVGPQEMEIESKIQRGVTISGGAGVPIGTVLVWLKFTIGTTEEITVRGRANVEAGYEGYWQWTDTFDHSSATYGEWYCTDEDVPGEITRIYLGEKTVTGRNFKERRYTPIISPV